MAGNSSEEKFLRSLSKLLTNRDLYPEKHPQILADISAIQEVFSPLFGERQERIFVFIEDQIFVDNRLLNSLQNNLTEISAIFREKKIDAFILRAGLTWSELESFLNALMMTKRDPAEKMTFSSPHIEVKELSTLGGAKPVVPSVMSSFSQDLNFSITKIAVKEARYSDETKIIRDVYADWNTVQNSLVSSVVKIMNTLENNLFENYQSFIPLADLKSFDEYTYVHALNLSILTMAQAESLGFSKDAVHAFGVGALLHDVGKTMIPIHVLNKEGQLTPEEFDEMKKHPVRGAMLLLQFQEIPAVSAIVAYEHHLKYDGTGYPLMRQRRKPHIASRLTSISDQFDAMRSNRPYREAMQPEKIFGLMQENRGTGLDPLLLDNFTRLMKARKFN